MTIARNVLDLMRNTPLVGLKGREQHTLRGQLWGKLELAMPGQMKDRVARRVIQDAAQRGALKPGGIVIESSSGTMAEGLARVGAALGYRVIIVTDPRVDAGLFVVSCTRRNEHISTNDWFDPCFFALFVKFNSFLFCRFAQFVERIKIYCFCFHFDNL